MKPRSALLLSFTRASFAVLAAASVSCGGKVVFESASTGGAGGTTSSASSTSSGVDCTGVDVGAAIFTCLQGPAVDCPEASSAAAHQRLAADLGLCDAVENYGGCCGQTGITAVNCGPTKQQIAEACCYYYTVEDPVGCYD